jgi:hypothetical protein
MKNTNFLGRVMMFASAAGVLVGAGCTSGDASWEGESERYAEDVYRSYADAAGGQVTFDVMAVDEGQLEDIAAYPAGELLGVPAEWLRMDARGTEITALNWEARDAERDEWSGSVDLGEFEALGWPVAEARYRLLDVTVRLNGGEARHQALEVCWSERARCIVMDPVVLQADAYYQDRQRLLAEGWAPEETVVKAGGSCTLNSSPTSTSKSITYGAYWVEYKNIFGVVLVRKDMGRQQVGVACYVSGDTCKSSGFGSSGTSSCFGNLGYSCDCDNTGNQIGTSADGSSTKSWSESKCAHRAFLNASASWTIEGVGSGFSINWDTAGSVDSNGGQLYDACSWH